MPSGAMRAAVYTGGKPNLSVTTVARPVPGPGEALLRVGACGICGSDLHVTEVDGIVQPGAILGHEIAGEIAAIGPDPIGDWRVGDRVFALPHTSCGRCGECLAGRAYGCENSSMGLGGTRPGQMPGAFAEYVRVGTNDLVALPNDMSYAVAALLEPLSVAMVALRLAALAPGDRVLVLGAGPIGLAITTLVQVFGARRVVVSEPTPHRRALATSLGATDLVDPTADADLRRQVRELTGGEPDVVFEAVGRPGMLNAAVAAVRVQGTVIAAGICREPDLFDHVTASAREATIRVPLYYTIEDTRTLMDLIQQGRLDPEPLLTHRVSLNDLPAVFEALRRPSDQLKVVVEP